MARVGRRLGVAAASAGAVVVVVAGPAGATWSIVAVDDESGEVGAALASCVPVVVVGDPAEPLAPIVLVPGSAVGVTQAHIHLAAPSRINQLRDAGVGADDIIVDLTSEEFDTVSPLRQYAIVDLDGGVAAFTGEDNGEVAGDRQDDAVSVQGNLAAGEEVLDDALDAFVTARPAAASLAKALVDGLVAGAEAGGDRRCPDNSALFAQVVVAEPDDAPSAPAMLLTAVVSEGSDDNPVELLAAGFDDGRTGVIDATGDEPRGGAVVRVVALVAAVVALVVAVVVFRRGLGSVASRR